MAHDHGSHGVGAHDHSHGHGAGHMHGSTDKKRVLIAACLTAGFMVAEALGGLLTGSLALLADAGHMLADAIALGLAWYAFHLAGRPATGRLTYGFARVKTLVAYTNGIAIFVIALWIVYEAWGRLIHPAPVLGGPMLVVAVAGLLVNIASFFVLHGGDREGLNMRGAILHVLGDLLGSAAAIVAALIILAIGWTPIDPILSVLVSLLILSTAWSLMREAAHVLLEGVPASLDRDLIAKDIEGAVKGVREVHHMHVWSLDGTSNMATLHACLNDGVDPHVAVSAIKKRLAAKHGIDHATVEPEFGLCADSHDEHDHRHDHDHAHDAPPDRRHYH
ncbi:MULTISPECIES: cation diffusion facilitator family transporter [unclassified Mesorhizobium]|uniref:cation diffusion facilitator family transporter n=1 Tax=unclassified Mesorhizobium TaxID=325217 RepID=UPI000F750F64|nr:MULTISPECIES: cation diffusion facilitator family transporter [unclassified Mesorhizobium]AZO21955.1 cation transporter [Mesorhizobium sp. M1E.F.Ca.ET.045.02.1.1]RUW26365.1 cation diffusion facilitator family transporter [Mesorhizobium sp. M1E.F.Ca.ET.041.01.1.1]RUW84159.1 cation diffusion facilitator family transporter [Mesorhizobium sp. M1E.F.Ca.ET.063.01.1.1]RWD90469.1 MAG: cation diffusion facilitator family transporter [Mesorhizobium sp.]RWD93594.1 MAG: cation diffusion facilitator fam